MDREKRERICRNVGDGAGIDGSVVLELLDWAEDLESQLAELTEKKAKSVIASEAGRELKRLEKLHDRYERDRNKLLDALSPEVAECVALLLNETRVSVSVVPGSLRASTLPAPPLDESPAETIERELAETEASAPPVASKPKEPADPRPVRSQKPEADVRREATLKRERDKTLAGFPNQ